MRKPILAYGCTMLRRPCVEIPLTAPDLPDLVNDLWETMYKANGCGLTAPQTGRAVNVFVVDSKTTYEQLGNNDRCFYFDKEDTGIRETFINAAITWYSTEQWEDEEGCLSIPGVLQAIMRPWSIIITYYNQQLERKTQQYGGLTARMIQHEYDHTLGKLPLDYLSPLKRKLLQSRLRKIESGKISPPYPMQFR